MTFVSIDQGDFYTHRLEIAVLGLFPKNTEVEQTKLTMAGDGSIEFFLDAFRAALVAHGFTPQTAQRLDLIGPKEGE